MSVLKSMSDEEMLLLLVKGTIADLPAQDKEAFDRCNQAVRDALKSVPEHVSTLVVGLIGAELQAQLS